LISFPGRAVSRRPVMGGPGVQSREGATGCAVIFGPTTYPKKVCRRGYNMSCCVLPRRRSAMPFATPSLRW
jgi:hypothetical protein